MSQLYTVGRVTADLEMKASAKETLYVRFSLAERIGRGGNTRTQYLDVWAFGRDAQSLLDRNVGKGCLIWLAGSLTLEAFERRDGTKDKRLKVILAEWGHVPGNPPEKPEAPLSAGEKDPAARDVPVSVIDGDREEWPE
jgi:single-stranded DNA-binding protein